MPRQSDRACPRCASANMVRRLNDWKCRACNETFETPNKPGEKRKSKSGSGQFAGKTYGQQLARNEKARQI